MNWCGVVAVAFDAIVVVAVGCSRGRLAYVLLKWTGRRKDEKQPSGVRVNTNQVLLESVE